MPLGEVINTPFEEGVCAFNKDFGTMYFSRCKKEKKEKLGCQIYLSKRSGTTWDKAEPLEITADSLVVAHPAISPDELTLYFVSDMPGGFGGKDIWRVTRDDPSGTFGEPVNLGADINTEFNELFPYVHPDGTLYFSSDGHVGMGGLDIYKAAELGNGGWKVENMYHPVNSVADDFGITFEAEKEKGFFSSTRDDFRGMDNIYSFYLPPLRFSIAGKVEDNKTEEKIPNTTVKLIGSDGSTLEDKTGDDGSFRFMLRPNTDYVIVTRQEEYLKGKSKVTTKGVGESKEFNTTIAMSPIDKPIDLPNIFFDLESAELRPESRVALDRLIEILNDNPNITIELSAHTDIRGSDEFNMKLSQKRAQSVVDYLVEHGVNPDRLMAKGYGSDKPKRIDVKMARKYPFLEEGDVLTPEFIENIETEEKQEIAHQINRRTEFKVLSTDYKTGE